MCSGVFIVSRSKYSKIDIPVALKLVGNIKETRKPRNVIVDKTRKSKRYDLKKLDQNAHFVRIIIPSSLMFPNL